MIEELSMIAKKISNVSKFWDETNKVEKFIYVNPVYKAEFLQKYPEFWGMVSFQITDTTVVMVDPSYTNLIDKSLTNTRGNAYLDYKGFEFIMHGLYQFARQLEKTEKIQDAVDKMVEFLTESKEKRC